MSSTLLGLEFSELRDVLGPAEPAYRARQVYDAVYRQKGSDIAAFSTLPKALREG